MSTIQAGIAVLGALVLLVGVGTAIFVYAKAGSQEKRIERLQGERDDLLSRLNYIEPKFKSTQEQNEMLLALVDPSARLADIKETVTETAGEILTAVERSASNTEAMKAVLLSQARTLDEIGRKMHEERGDRS